MPVCLCVLHAYSAHRGQKRAFKWPCEWWEPNPGPPKEQHVSQSHLHSSNDLF